MKIVFFFVLLCAFHCHAQSVVLTEMQWVNGEYQMVQTIPSGAVINRSFTDNFSFPVQISSSNLDTLQLQVNVVENEVDSCITDVLKIHVDPDPNFQSTCFYPSALNWTSFQIPVVLSAVNYLIVKPEFIVNCETCQRYTYTILNNAVVIDSFTLELCGNVLATTDFLEKNTIVYPNPSSNQLTVSLDESLAEITVLDMLGNRIKAFETNAKVFSIADLPSGSYLLELKTVQNEPLLERFEVHH